MLPSNCLASSQGNIEMILAQVTFDCETFMRTNWETVDHVSVWLFLLDLIQAMVSGITASEGKC